MTGPVYLPAVCDAIVRHLTTSPRDMSLLKQRLANAGRYAAYSMTLAELAPELPATYYADVVDMVSRALRARVQGRIRRVARA